MARTSGSRLIGADPPGNETIVITTLPVDMNKNPLTSIVLVFVIGDVLTMWQSINSHTVTVFTAIAWVQGIILLALYLGKSPVAGSYLFYSTLPFFPIYFGLRLAGLAPPPKTLVVYLVAGIIYAVAIPLLWKTKREYDIYVAKTRMDIKH